MTQQQVQKPKAEHAQPAPQDTDTPQGAEVTTGLAEDVEDILDEIDAVLEVNAEEFVRGFVQKGGQ